MVDVPDEVAISFLKFVLSILQGMGIMFLIGLWAAVVYAALQTIKQWLS